MRRQPSSGFNLILKTKIKIVQRLRIYFFSIECLLYCIQFTNVFSNNLFAKNINGQLVNPKEQNKETRIQSFNEADSLKGLKVQLKILAVDTEPRCLLGNPHYVALFYTNEFSLIGKSKVGGRLVQSSLYLSGFFEPIEIAYNSWKIFPALKISCNQPLLIDDLNLRVSICPTTLIDK